MKTIKNDIKNELIIKNSKFITLLIKIDDNSNIKNILDQAKEKYPKATHYCYGYITETSQKSSDDNEPSGTAGLPIINVLEKEKIINVLAIVIRYFGGIKLGAGGLIRAYSKGVKKALEKSKLTTLTPGYEIDIKFNYDQQKDIDYLLKDIKIINKEYLENIVYTVLIPREKVNIINNYNYKIKKDLLIEK